MTALERLESISQEELEKLSRAEIVTLMVDAAAEYMVALEAENERPN